MYTIEWLSGKVEKYHSRESWQTRADKLKAMGFHENWDFYCFKD